MEISIKNMVCPRCISSVTEIARSCGLQPKAVSLGLCEFDYEPDAVSLERFKSGLLEAGFEVLSSREEKMVQDVKTSLVDLVYNHSCDLKPVNLSDYLQEKIGASYSLIRNVFSSMEGRSVDNYYISLRIERAKELVRYDELTLSEIADQLGYSSASHLSSQFKKMTGLSPSQFRTNLGKRKNLDSI